MIVVGSIARGILFCVPRLPIRPFDERPPAMYGHFCLVPRVSAHDRYYCIGYMPTRQHADGYVLSIFRLDLTNAHFTVQFLLTVLVSIIVFVICRCVVFSFCDNHVVSVMISRALL